MTALPTGTYASIINGYLGFLSQQGQANIWQQYLSQNGLLTAPPETPTQLANFVTFVNSTYGSLEVNQDVASPNAMAETKIISEVLDMALKMMTTLQQSQQSENDALNFNVQYQEQYTAMSAATPLYSANPTETVAVNSSNISQTTFGYSNINLQDIFEYGVNQVMQNPSQGAVYVPAFQLTQAQVNSLVSTIPEFSGLAVNGPGGFVFSSPNGNSVQVQAYYFTSSSGLVTNITQPIIVNLPQNQSQIPSQAAALINQMTNIPSPAGGNVLTQFLGPLNGISAIPWRPGTTGTDTTSQQEQANYNAQFQLFTNTAQAQRQAIQSQATPLQSLISQTQDSVTNMSNLLKSIIDTMEGLLASIYQ